MTRRYIPHGQRFGNVDGRSGHQSMRRADGARLERAEILPALPFRKIVGFVLFVVVLALVANGDLILGALK